MTLSRIALTMALATISGAALSAQVTTAPTLGAAPALTLPAVERAVLPNGLTILVSRNAEVPIVEGRLHIEGGARLAGVRSGLPSFATSALMEGAGGMTGVRLAEEIDLLGADIGAAAGWESFTVSVRAPKRTIDKALGLMADVALRPNFAAADVGRLRDLRLAALAAARDRPGTVAGRVFYRNVYPAGLPYHQDIGGDSANVVHFDSAAVRSLWTRAIDPRKATFVITGDVTLAEARTWIAAHFGDWAPPADPLVRPPASSVPAAPRPATHIILVDKPGAAQSVIYIGAPGITRDSPDYPAIALMNTVLGGSFSARLNDVLREQLGYSYGASSFFSWGPVPGAFVAQSQVRTNVTDSSLAVFFREFRRIRDEQLTPVELQRGKNYLVLGSLSDYETAGQVADALTESLYLNRPLTLLPAEFKRIDQLTLADVQNAARRYLDPDHLTVVVVGDLAKIRAGIEKLKLGNVDVQVF